MELRHLRYFVAVAEELHFRRAAERLYVAQPAVSEQVRKLEDELGVRLFDRTHRNVTLTNAGNALLEEARRVLQQADIAQTAARTAAHAHTDHLRIGHLPDLLPPTVTRAMRTLAATGTHTHLRLHTGPALRLIAQLRAHQLDIAIVALPIPTTGLRVLRAGTEHTVAVLPANHPHATATTLSLHRLAPERILVMPRDSNPAHHSAIIATCRDAGLAPELIETPEARTDHVLLAVAAGAGMALLPASAAHHHHIPGLRFIPLDHHQPTIEHAALTHPDTTNHLATARFLSAITHAGRREPSPAPEPAPVRLVA